MSTRHGIKKRKFYVVNFGAGSRASGFKLLSDATSWPPSFVPSSGLRGFRCVAKPPLFLADPKIGRVDRDFEGYFGFWFISDRMKRVLEEVDKDGFDFLRCDIRLPNESVLPDRWLCDVIRVIDALDEEKSSVKSSVADDGSKVYQMVGRPSMVFKEDVVGSYHVFRMKYFQPLVICDDELKQACRSAAVTGISFELTV